MQPFGLSVRCVCSARFFVTGSRSCELEPSHFSVQCPACGVLIHRETMGQVDLESLSIRPAD